MKCPRCGMSDGMYPLGDRYYCRRCLAFGRIFDDWQLERRVVKTSVHHVSYHLNFSLSPAQQAISEALITHYQHHENTLLLAVCGSGKTEISFGVISYALNHGGRVCFCIPRKALCVELYERFNECFDGITIGLVYGDCKKYADADFIICTTHQLYRYIATPFDLLLIDEADAFPFYGDAVLNHFFDLCTGGVFIKMSATLREEDIHDEKVLILNRRYHGFDLPVPQKRILPRFLWVPYLLYEIRKMLKNDEKILVYVPVFADLDYYQRRLGRFCRLQGVSSHTPDINRYVDQLRNGVLDVLLTTTILERGVTITNAQVLVIHASHPIFDDRTLMQIAGRVGRKIGYEQGRVLFIDQYTSKEMKKCIRTIKKLNALKD